VEAPSVIQFGFVIGSDSKANGLRGYLQVLPQGDAQEGMGNNVLLSSISHQESSGAGLFSGVEKSMQVIDHAVCEFKIRMPDVNFVFGKDAVEISQLWAYGHKSSIHSMG
jgi:hypothetical protein